MKHLKKIIVMPLFIGLILSCEQKNEIKLDRVTELTNQVVSSIQFTSLQIKLSDLNLAGSKYVDVKKNSIAIPFAGRDDRKGVVAIFDENDGLRGVMEFEMLTDVDSDQIYAELQKGTFNGTFIYRIGTGKMSIQLEKSKVIASSIARMDGSTLAFKCLLWDEVILCASSAFENMNWFDKAYCYASFVSCIANLIISCFLDGCASSFA